MESLEPGPKRKIKARLKRGVYLLPSICTVGTLVCGYYAIMNAFKGAQMLAGGMEGGLAAFDAAAKAIGWGVVFDMLDGRIARLTNSSSDFGREFDSLADIVTFGLAPGVLAFAWGVRPMEDVYGTQLAQHLRQVGWIVTFAYVICGAARLARFNIASSRPAADRRYFIGLPIPAAAGVIASLVHWAKSPINDWVFGLAWPALLALLAFLMVSRVRYFSFKTIDLRRPRPFIVIIVLGLVVWAMWAYSEVALLFLSLGFTLHFPLVRLIPKFRPQTQAPQDKRSVSHEVHTA